MRSDRPAAAKVFCIGLHKTGTKSLAAALTELGYRVHGPAWTRDHEACASLPVLWRHARPVIPQFDAFQDNPWPLLWRQLLDDYPDARYILTVRDESDWLQSVCRYFGDEQTPMRELLYGRGAAAPRGNEALYLQRYRAHNRAVREALAGRENFLELHIGQGWEPLCDFLDKPMPERIFPHENRSAEGRSGSG